MYMAMCHVARLYVGLLKMIKADMMLAGLAVELAAPNIQAPTVIQPEAH
jgi:hypothetical protein